MVGKKPQIVLFCLLLLAGAAVGQTFELGNQNPTTPNKSAKKKPKAQTSSPQPSAPSSEGSIGWGSGIEVARDSRAAQQALQRNDYSSAVMYANRAANAAPQNTGLWFLLGYSARLAGQYQVSINAYNRGLRNQPGSIQGLSGLAQTYVKMGRQAEACDALQKVLAANPRSDNDLQ